MSTKTADTKKTLELHRLAAAGFLNHAYEVEKFRDVYLRILTEIKNGANLCAKDSDNRTPLHIACTYLSADLIPLLASDPNAFHVFDRIGNAPIHTIVWAKTPDVVKQQFSYHKIKEGISRDIEDLIQGFREELITKFVIEGADLNLRNGNDLTPLHLAVLKGQKGTLKALLNLDADPNIVQPKTNQTPLHAAITAEKYDLAEILLQSPKIGQSINVQTSLGSTALLIAAKQLKEARDTPTIKRIKQLMVLLIQNNANPAIANNNGEKPENFCEEFFNEEPMRGYIKKLKNSNQGNASTSSGLDSGIVPDLKAVNDATNPNVMISFREQIRQFMCGKILNYDDIILPPVVTADRSKTQILKGKDFFNGGPNTVFNHEAYLILGICHERRNEMLLVSDCYQDKESMKAKCLRWAYVVWIASDGRYSADEQLKAAQESLNLKGRDVKAKAETNDLPVIAKENAIQTSQAKPNDTDAGDKKNVSEVEAVVSTEEVQTEKPAETTSMLSQFENAKADALNLKEQASDSDNEKTLAPDSDDEYDKIQAFKNEGDKDNESDKDNEDDTDHEFIEYTIISTPSKIFPSSL